LVFYRASYTCFFLEPQHLAWYLHYLPIPFKASFGKARNGLRSTRIKLARFETRSGPEAPFVLGGPDWKRARFGLLPTPSGPESTPTSHPPDPIRIGAQRGGRGWRGTAREATAPRHGDALAASLSSPAFSPVSRYPCLPCPLLSPTLGFLLGFSPVLGFLDLAGDGSATSLAAGARFGGALLLVGNAEGLRAWRGSIACLLLLPPPPPLPFLPLRGDGDGVVRREATRKAWRCDMATTVIKIT